MQSNASCDTSRREMPESGRLGATIFLPAQEPPVVVHRVSGVRAHDVGLPGSAILSITVSGVYRESGIEPVGSSGFDPIGDRGSIVIPRHDRATLASDLSSIAGGRRSAGNRNP